MFILLSCILLSPLETYSHGQTDMHTHAPVFVYVVLKAFFLVSITFVQTVLNKPEVCVYYFKNEVSRYRSC
jgi:uncharacterized membrane protein YcfT